MGIVIKDLSFGFAGKALFQKINLEIGEGPVVILGPSGCGKTTLLRLVAGLLKAEQGEVRVDLGSTRSCSFVFQEARLLPWKNVLDNVTLPAEGIVDRKTAEERAARFLSLLGIADKARSFPHELSGGQKQRANIARAFTYPSPVLLMDEAFQSLDFFLRIELLENTVKLLEADPRLTVLVTHDPREALFLGNRIIVLGKSPRGVVYDEKVVSNTAQRSYGSSAEAEQKLLCVLRAEAGL